MEVRSLSEFYNFGETLEVMIHDCLVCGINDTAVQKCLLAEPELTYEKAVEISLNAETAAHSLWELRPKPESGMTAVGSQQQEVFKSTATPPKFANRTALTCYHCGKRGHVVASCHVDKGIMCHRCGKAEHLQRACRGKAKSGLQRTGNGRAKPAVGKIKQEAAESDSDNTRST